MLTMSNLETKNDIDDPSPDELWSEKAYSLTVIITASILIVLYLLTMYKACKGT